MRGILATAIVATLASTGSLAFATDPSLFPAQVGGWRFRTNRTQAEDKCTKSGGRFVGTPAQVDSGRGETLLCTVVPESPAIMAPASALGASLCKSGSLCVISMMWDSVSHDQARTIVKTFEARYGGPTVGAGSSNLSTLAGDCQLSVLAKTGPSDRHLDLSWSFDAKTAKGADVTVGTVYTLVKCNADGSLGVTAMYGGAEWQAEAAKQPLNF